MKHKYHYAIQMDLVVTESYQADQIEKLMRDAAAMIADGMRTSVTAKLMCWAGSKEIHKSKPIGRMDLVARQAKMEAAGYRVSQASAAD